MRYLIGLFVLTIIGMSLVAPRQTIISTAQPYAGAYSGNHWVQ